MFRGYQRIFLIIVVISLCCGCQSVAPNDFTVIASIGGEPVALGELKMFLGGSGITARSALEELVPYIVCRRELKRLGDTTFETYKAFWDAWQAENAGRAEALSHGEVVYGPEALSQRVFYSYTHESDMKRLSSLLAVEPTEDELRAAYDERTELFTIMGLVNMRVTLLPQGYDITVVGNLRAALAGGESYDVAVRQLGLDEMTYPRTFTSSDFRSPDVTEFDGVADAIRDLPVGDIWEPIDNNGEGWIVLYCESREGAGRESFNECRATLAQLLRDERFERDFATLVDDAEIKYDVDLDKIAAIQ
jgi:hypothetical protein